MAFRIGVGIGSGVEAESPLIGNKIAISSFSQAGHDTHSDPDTDVPIFRPAVRVEPKASLVALVDYWRASRERRQQVNVLLHAPALLNRRPPLPSPHLLGKISRLTRVMPSFLHSQC